jgi:SNF2 family DNA or RNA helicase
MLLALSPGLGKTLVSIASAWIRGFKRVLVIAPLALVPNWCEEIEKWYGQYDKEVEVVKVHGSGPPEDPSWVVTNYDTITNRLPLYQRPWDLVICDESVLLKTRKGPDKKKKNRTQKIASLREHTKHLWLLSGSPTTRYADDLYAQFNAMFPGDFSSYWRFAEAYCYVNKGEWGTEITGTRRNINLQREFKDIMFVRHQKDVLPDLPDLLFNTLQVPLAPHQRRYFETMLNDFIIELENGDEIKVNSRIAQLTRLQQIVSHPVNLGLQAGSAKLETLIELLELGEIPTPCILWTHWRETGAHACDRLRDAGYKVGLVRGDTKNPQETIALFKANKLDILVLSLTVGRYGHTLINAQSMVYFDRTFDSDSYLQSLGRVHRIGLDHSTYVLTLHASKTTDDLIRDNLAGKILSVAKITNADLAMLLRSLDKGK